jgi:hypothetical protein
MNLETKSKNSQLFFGPLLLICFGLFFIAGCYFTPSKVALPLESLYSKNLKTLENGNLALKTGDTKKARSIFQHLRQQARNSDIQLRCLYGLACAELTLADNITEFEAALALWNQWIKQAPPGRDSGDPRLLYPLLKSRLTEKKAFQAKIKALQSLIDKQNSKNLIPKDRDIETLNEKLKIKNQKIEQLEQKQAALKAMIQKLEHQINAMKAIDLKIEEKKEEIAAP